MCNDIVTHSVKALLHRKTPIDDPPLPQICSQQVWAEGALVFPRGEAPSPHPWGHRGTKAWVCGGRWARATAVAGAAARGGWGGGAQPHRGGVLAARAAAVPSCGGRCRKVSRSWRWCSLYFLFLFLCLCLCLFMFMFMFLFMFMFMFLFLLLLLLFHWRWLGS